MDKSTTETSAERRFAELIARLDASQDPTGEHDLHSPLRTLRSDLEAEGTPPPHALLAEEIAFLVHAHDHQGPSEWGLHFGPMMSGPASNGGRWDVPSLASMTPEVLQYWASRVDASRNPVMKARYSDLLWEMPGKLKHADRDVRFARAAVDSYLEAVEQGRYDPAIVSVGKVRRALNLALAISDPERPRRSRVAACLPGSSSPTRS